MTETPNNQPQETPPTTTETPAQTTQAQQSLTQDQWNEFLGGLAAQNQNLQAQVNNMSARDNQRAIQERQAEINAMPDKDRADQLQAQLDGIRNAGAAAQAQEISNNVWQRRDADAASRLLTLHGLNGTEAELYRGGWDVNWMPRFVASVEGLVKGKAAKAGNATDPANNPANRANLGGSTSSALPEIDANASGFDTIRYALSRQKQP